MNRILRAAPRDVQSPHPRHRPTALAAALGDPGRRRLMRGVNPVPFPTKCTLHGGAFTLDVDTVVACADQCRPAGDFLCSVLRPATGYAINLVGAGVSAPAGNVIHLDIDNKLSLGDEGYRLKVSDSSVRISAATPAGLFYGCQTLRQLLPEAIESRSPVANVPWDIPALEIEDSPRFPWRGSLLDSARHFQSLEYVKQYIDLLACHKMNRFHWHLTDDQGWRVEIRKYPALTDVGAWRTQPDGSRYGGFHTQEQVREIVSYAADRHVMVIPEIDMPGHTSAATASYPQLCCTGSPPPIPSAGGNCVDVFCAGNDDVYRFARDVLEEVAGLFPAPYIHIGGDECRMDRWKQCPKCQTMIAKRALGTERALLRHFTSRIEDIIAGLGKRLIGWDEIFERDSEGIGHEVAVTYPDRPDDDILRQGTLIQAWRNPAGGAAAVRLGHDVIMSTQSHTYVSYPCRTLPIEKAYSYDPIPAGLDACESQRILGLEGCLWAENAPTPEVTDRLVFPRLSALAEVAWTAASQKNFDRFRSRLVPHCRRLLNRGVNCSTEIGAVKIMFDPVLVDGETFRSGEVVFRVENNADEPVWVTGTVEGNPLLAASVGSHSLIVGPRSSQNVKTGLAARSPLTVGKLEPVIVRWKSAYKQEGSRDVSSSFTTRVVPERRMHCGRQRGDILLDGSLKGWGRLPFTFGDADCSSRFGVCFGGQYVYFGAQVRKKDLVLDQSGMPWEQDGIEVRFDAREERTRFYSDGEYEFVDILPFAMAPSLRPEQTGAFYRRDDLPQGARAVCVRNETGFAAEIAVPVGWLDKQQGRRWESFRLNVTVNCSDGARVRKIHWRPEWRSPENCPWSGTFRRKSG